MQSADASGAEAASGVESVPLFGPERGCDLFEQRLLRFRGPSPARTQDDSDEVLYVVSGSATAAFDDERFPLAPGSAAYIARGASWVSTQRTISSCSPSSCAIRSRRTGGRTRS